MFLFVEQQLKLFKSINNDDVVEEFKTNKKILSEFRFRIIVH